MLLKLNLLKVKRPRPFHAVPCRSTPCHRLLSPSPTFSRFPSLPRPRPQGGRAAGDGGSADAGEASMPFHALPRPSMP